MINIFWFRRDLRLDDNAGLFQALKDGIPVLPLFIFDENILGRLEEKDDPRITFIHDEITRLKNQIEKSGSSLLVKSGNPEDVFKELIGQFLPVKVFANHDYEPYATERDERIRLLLHIKGIQFKTFKDQVIFEKDEIIKDNGEPYTVFTPYSKKWKLKLNERKTGEFHSAHFSDNFLKTAPFNLPVLGSLGFIRKELPVPSMAVPEEILRNYHLTRDYPGLNGTSRLSIHLRFGTISIRKLVSLAVVTNEVFLNELIWREFYMMIMWHFPHVTDHSFRKKYDLIRWKNNENEFDAWCKGMTGYPIVDAGMREMNQTGYMHNRARMITASFLTKHLLTDWRWGEAYFARKLMDYELSSNNGGWQWAAGTGCDAAPYFRVFNPDLQAAKFDPDKKYIRRWIPEINTVQYPGKIISHSEARNLALSAYRKALGNVF